METMVNLFQLRNQYNTAKSISDANASRLSSLSTAYSTLEQDYDDRLSNVSHAQSTISSLKSTLQITESLSSARTFGGEFRVLDTRSNPGSHARDLVASDRRGNGVSMLDLQIEIESLNDDAYYIEPLLINHTNTTNTDITNLSNIVRINLSKLSNVQVAVSKGYGIPHSTTNDGKSGGTSAPPPDPCSGFNQLLYPDTIVGGCGIFEPSPY